LPAPPPAPCRARISGTWREIGSGVGAGASGIAGGYDRLRIFASGLCSGHARRELAMERHVKLFRNGQNQAVRIPREFELPDTDAIMRKAGDRLILEPAPKHPIDRLLAVLATLEDLPDDEQLPATDDLPPEPFDL
jgi:antitoxin VapB